MPARLRKQKVRSPAAASSSTTRGDDEDNLAGGCAAGDCESPCGADTNRSRPVGPDVGAGDGVSSLGEPEDGARRPAVRVEERAAAAHAAQADRRVARAMAERGADRTGAPPGC